MNRKVKTPDGGDIGYITNKRPIWAEGKKYYDSYTFVKLGKSRTVAYTNAESLIPLEDDECFIQHCNENINKVLVQKTFYKNKRAPITIERS